MFCLLGDFCFYSVFQLCAGFQCRFLRALSWFLNFFFIAMLLHGCEILFLRRFIIWGKFSFASCIDLFLLFPLSCFFLSLSHIGDFFSDVLSSFIICSYLSKASSFLHTGAILHSLPSARMELCFPTSEIIKRCPLMTCSMK